MPLSASQRRHIRKFLDEPQQTEDQIAALASKTKMSQSMLRSHLRQARQNIRHVQPKQKRSRDGEGRYIAHIVRVDTLPSHPDITRALLISLEWIIKILHGGKIWELRSFNTSPCWFYLLATKGGGIRGHARVVETFKTTAKKLNTRSAKKKHCVDAESVTAYCKGSARVWVLADVVAYAEAIPCTFPRGCCTWVTEGLPTVTLKQRGHQPDKPDAPGKPTRAKGPRAQCSRCNQEYAVSYMRKHTKKAHPEDL